MPHVEKYTQAKINLILAHDLRAKSTEFRSADSSLEHNNIYYVNNGNGLIQIRDDNKKMLAAARKYQEQLLQNTPHAKRKDLVTLGEWIVNCPKDIPENDRMKFLEASMKFVSERYGSRNIVSAAMHLDEPNAMPHMHITVVPVDKKGRICARNVFTRQELQHFHPDLERYASRALGYPVHILRDEEERAKVSLPLSQYKVKTKSEELDKKEKALEKQSAEVADKLETAENTVSNARISAMSAASARLENYEKTSALKRFFTDPRPFIRDMTVELETAAELDRKIMDQREKELEIRELELEAEADDLRKEKDFREQEEYELQQRMKEAEHMYKQAESKVQAARKYEQSVKARENELIKKENALAEREKSINERESKLKANADKYWNQRAADYHFLIDDAQRKYVAAEQALQKSFELEKKNWAWDAEREQWKTVEEANKAVEKTNGKFNELSLKYKSLSDKYNAIHTQNTANIQVIEALKAGNEKLCEDNTKLRKENDVANRKISYLRWRCEEFDKYKAKYSELSEKYDKLSTLHNSLKSLHDSTVDYAETITTENAFLSDIIGELKYRLTDKQEYTIQVCEQIEQKYINKTSDKKHVEAISNIIDNAEKQKATYKAKIDNTFEQAIRESRIQEQNRCIYRENNSRGRSR